MLYNFKKATTGLATRRSLTNNMRNFCSNIDKNVPVCQHYDFQFIIVRVPSLLSGNVTKSVRFWYNGKLSW